MNSDEFLENYYKSAASWENDVSRIANRSLKFSWFITAVSLTIAALCAASLVLLLPLKSYEPYVIEVDKTTGYLEVKRPLVYGSITPSEAVTTMFAVRYILARETYDPVNLQKDFNDTQAFSSGTALTDFHKYYAPDSPQNPVNIYGRRARIIPTVKSVDIQDGSRALVRFSLRTIEGGTETSSDWLATLTYSYAETAIENQKRFDNPLGFSVSDYRREQEGAGASGAAQ